VAGFDKSRNLFSDSLLTDAEDVCNGLLSYPSFSVPVGVSEAAAVPSVPVTACPVCTGFGSVAAPAG
ncbi:MAG: hypothetical protein ACK56F_06440, partial [bacterium]